MNFTRLILSDLRHYRKAFLGILAGTVLSTAVLTGALVLGDSVRFSLMCIGEMRLGKIRFVLNSNGSYFRYALAGELAQKTGGIAAPVLLSEGNAVNPETNSRINRVQVLGIDSRFPLLWANAPACPDDNSAVISLNTAEKLSLKQGDYILLRISKQGMAPANAPFVAENSPSAAFRFRVASIADDEHMGRFSLKNNQGAPFNVFVSSNRLQAMLGLKGKANALLLGATPEGWTDAAKPDSLLQTTWKPEDAGLDIRKLDQYGSCELRSERIFINKKAEEAVKSVLTASRGFLTWLANSLTAGEKTTPYSFVTAVSPDFLGTDPGQHGIIINSWLADDLGAKKGDSLRLKYFVMGSRGQLTEDSSVFTVVQVRPLTDAVWDPSLMPAFPGMSEAGNCRDWETGAPVDLKRVRDKDEEYWKRFRGTPKAFISLDAGRALWKNDFGTLTSLRFEASPLQVDSIRRSIADRLSPRSQGLVFIPVYREGMKAAASSTDFGELFLSLGFFIILAALVLVALLFSLHLQGRMKESGILSAMGFSKRQVFRILSTECLIIALSGGIIGAAAGILYNRLMLLGLNTIWLDAVGTPGLVMTVRPWTLISGVVAGTLVSFPVMLTVLVTNLRKKIARQTSAAISRSPRSERRKKITGAVLSAVFFTVSAGMIAFLILSSRTNETSLFLAAGAMLIISGSLAIYSILAAGRRYNPNPTGSLFLLALRNASIRRSRTMSVIVMLAIGMFSIFITAANRRTFYGSELEKQSGSGGFQFWAETSIPLRYDPASAMGIKEYGLPDEAALSQCKVIALRKLDGDDASCLNLNMAARPSVLGLPVNFFRQRGAFNFVSLLPGIDPANPWEALEKPAGKLLIPAFADQTVITWGLQKKLGDTLFYINGRNDTIGIMLAGGLDNSIFQGYLLVSDSLLRIHFPSVSGYSNLLVDGPAASSGEIAGTLEDVFSDYGMTVTPAPERLASFNAVENTYLSVFMLLGGLGMLIGTIGLGLVLLRNMNERKNELAIYTAMGYKRSLIMKLVLAEYLLTLIAGAFLGMISAAAGILPSILSPAFQMPSVFLLLLASAFLLNGLLWIWLSARALLRRFRSDTLSKGLAM